ASLSLAPPCLGLVLVNCAAVADTATATLTGDAVAVIGVLFVVKVPGRAVCLCGLRQTRQQRRVATTNVLPGGHRLQMVRSNTRGGAAEMVYEHAIRNWPYQRLIREAMRVLLA